MKATATRRDFADSDRAAPYTPWGKAQSVATIARGVRWVSTASHGGLGVSAALALKVFSEAAMRECFVQGGYFWFEEDCAAAVAFAEHPEWEAALRAANRAS